jgi:hypothetical protein
MRREGDADRGGCCLPPDDTDGGGRRRSGRVLSAAGLGEEKGRETPVFFSTGHWGLGRGDVDAEGAGPRRTREASGGRRGMKARGGTT